MTWTRIHCHFPSEEEWTETMRGLFVGAIVLYVHHLGDGRYKDVAAIVIDVYDKERGNINVREMDHLHIRSCLYSEQHEGGTWHWLEAV